MMACGRGGWALCMFNSIGLATAPRADEIAPAVTRAQTQSPLGQKVHDPRANPGAPD